MEYFSADPLVFLGHMPDPMTSYKSIYVSILWEFWAHTVLCHNVRINCILSLRCGILGVYILEIWYHLA